MSLLDMVWPKRCVGCGVWGKYVCEKCEVGLWEEEQICPACRRASRYGLRHRYCKRPWSMEGLTAFWAYEGIAKKIVGLAKYRYYYDMLRELMADNAQVTARPELSYFLNFLGTGPTSPEGYVRGDDRPVIVPVPLYSQRERERGFNQAGIMAKLAAGNWKLETREMLGRVRDTGRQVGRTRESRLENVRDAFAMNTSPLAPLLSKERVKGVPTAALLVDDVWTTGATMNECAKVLRQAGVRRVWGLVLAR